MIIKQTHERRNEKKKEMKTFWDTVGLIKWLKRCFTSYLVARGGREEGSRGMHMDTARRIRSL